MRFLAMTLTLAVLPWSLSLAQDGTSTTPAQTPTPVATPAPAVATVEAPPAAPEVMDVTVWSVEGDVDVLLPGQADWQPAAKDLVLPQGSRIFTGMDSDLLLHLGKIGVVKVRAFSELEVNEFLLQQKTVMSKLDLRTGDVEVQVEKGTYQASLQVRTPNATASVRGTDFGVGASGDFGTRCGGREGLVAFSDHHGRQQFVGAGDVSRKTPGNAEVQRPSDAKKEDSVTNVTPQGATRDEQRASTQISSSTSGVLASDTTQQQGNPAFQRIISRDRRLSDQSRATRIDDPRRRDVPPPIRTQ